MSDPTGIFDDPPPPHAKRPRAPLQISIAGTLMAEARASHVRTRDLIRGLRERRSHAYCTLGAFGLSRGQIALYRTESYQELRGKAERNEDIVVQRARGKWRACISSQSVLDLVHLIGRLDARIEWAKKGRRAPGS